MANIVRLEDLLHDRAPVVPQIYGYTIPGLKDHDGYIKIGYTGREDVNIRIGEQLHTGAIKYKIVFVESAMRNDGTVFLDHEVRDLLVRKGFKHLYDGEDNNEWIKCSKEDALTAIMELRFNKRFESTRTEDFGMRNEQKNAVEMTYSYFRKMKEEEPDSSPKFLWNAKMRFGKTFATYELAKKMDMKRVLVLTFKPAVETAWYDDLMHHVDFDGWQFVSNKEAKYDAAKIDRQYESCDPNKPIVLFGSFQDLLGTNEAGGIKAKNEFIHTVNWDMVVLDEYHFGAWRENAKALFAKDDEEDVDFDIEKYSAEEAGNAINETWLPITTSYYLYLSGTPFRAINSGEFLEDQIFNWTYSDEQQAKADWNPKDGPNPYAALPKMVMLTYKVPESITEIAMNEGFDEFDINEFFKAEFEKGKEEQARFKYEDYVQKWVKMIQGDYLPVDGLKLGSERPPMPYSDTTLLNVLSHTLWFLPNVASCYAMYNLLRMRQNKFFDDYEIIVCAGIKAGIGVDALAPVERAMGDPLKTKTITLTCGKLTTGVTVRPWSGIFMLRNLKSPETYFQAAFRVQSPWEITDEEGNRKVVKEECFIFDFALERALRQVSDYSCRLQVDDASPEQKVSDFINFLPILAFDGSSMNSISAQDVLDITYSGTSATLLAKRWQTAMLVHVDNDTLLRLKDNPEAMTALMSIEGFRALNNDIETIINRSNRAKTGGGKDGPQTKKEKKEIDEAKKEAKALRKQVQEKLLKLAARIPAFMYLTDYREQTIKDVITQIEPDLFKKVTGLDVKDFELLCSIGLFDPEKMNQGIFGFRRYENSSLSYAGIDMHEGEDIGGWDTVLKRKEYDELYASQQATVTDFIEIMLPSEDKKKKAEPVTFTKTESVVDRYQTSKDKAKPAEPEKPKINWSEILKDVGEGTKVNHKQKFGEGVVIALTKNKYLKVKFAEGEKMFIFPDAFVNGFLSLE